ncbi:MAG TPA: hypothetical protein VHU83_23215 [Bryobacteraceae bacterium]|jgi:hypothetical protein|nr:hypothetical protein [Bryobacteraceae bacterium]
MAKLPPEILEFFKKQGRKGGKTAAAMSTPEQRAERARKAAAKSAEVRSKKAAAKKKSKPQKNEA